MKWIMCILVLAIPVAATQDNLVYFGTDGNRFAGWDTQGRVFASLQLDSYDPLHTLYTQSYVYFVSSRQRIIERVSRQRPSSTTTIIEFPPLVGDNVIALEAYHDNDLVMLYSNIDSGVYALDRYDASLGAWQPLLASLPHALDRIRQYAACICNASSTLYVAMQDSRNVHAIDIASGALLETYQAPTEPGLVLDIECVPADDTLIVLTQHTDRFEISSLLSQTVLASYEALDKISPRIHDFVNIAADANAPIEQLIGIFQQQQEQPTRPLQLQDHTILVEPLTYGSIDVELVGVTEIALFGPDTSSLTTLGTLYLGGELVVHIDQLPQDGETFTLFEFSSASGSFDSILVQTDLTYCEQLEYDTVLDQDSFRLVFRVDRSICENVSNKAHAELLSLMLFFHLALDMDFVLKVRAC